MRGSPLWRAVAAFLVLLGLGIPTWKLTHEVVANTSPTGATPNLQAEVLLQLTFTSLPASLRVSHLGREVWNVAAPAQEVERKLALVFPEEGIDLLFQVTWPADAPLAAMRMRLTDAAGETHEKSVWGTGALEEAVTFP